MPFTVSHVAAVLPASRVPALRDPLAMSALAIGAMSPDVPYFVPLSTWMPSYAWSEASHTWAGLVLINLPVTLALVALYWLVLAAPLRALAPDGVRARLPRDVMSVHRAAPGRALALVTAGAAIGVTTHIVWDAFTHEGLLGAVPVPWLHPLAAGAALPGYGIPQYGGSLVGLGLLAWSALRWYQRTPASAEVPEGAGVGWRVAFVGSVLTAGLVAWWSVVDVLGTPSDLYDANVLAITGITRSIGLMALIAVLAVLPLRAVLQRTDLAALSR